MAEDADGEAVSGGPDPWLLAGMPGAPQHPTYLVERLAPQYRLIVDALLDEESHSLTGVAQTDLPALLLARVEAAIGREAGRALLDDTVFDLDARMEQLRRWGAVEVWQDRATTE